MSKIGKALMSLLLDKKARDALHTAQQQPRPARATSRPAPPSPVAPPQLSVKAQLAAKLDEVQNRPKNNGSPDRKQLIQNAMRVRSSKQDILSDLSQEQRLKLQVLAMKAMMPNGSDGQGH
ncbi:MAG: hypothetical protein JKY27_13680 [Magnetovibrio sp.]|nr:hypothetical protein [Magnetovibrio sp.]